MQYSGTKTSQPYISKVILEKAEDNQLKVVVRVALSNSGLQDSMTTNIVKVTDAKIIKTLSQNSKGANIELIENAFHPGKFGTLSLAAGEVKTLPRDSGEFERGFRIVTQEFLVDQDITNLTFYVVCQHDLNHPRYRKLASSDNFKRKVVNDASIVAENVFKSGQLVKKSRVFVYSNIGETIENKERDYSIVRGNKRIWTGPVHYHSSNNPGPNGYVGYMAGPTSHMGPKLKLASSPNATIHDYRVLEQIERIPFNCKVRQDQPLAHKRNAYFSNLCVTSDKDGFVRLFFAVDMGEIIKNNAKLPRLVAVGNNRSINLDHGKASFKDVSNLSVINKISIQRERVKSSGDLIEGDDLIEAVVESSQVGIRVVNATKQISFIKNDDVNHKAKRTVGSIREIENLFVLGVNNDQAVSNNIRYFTVTDFSTSNNKDGLFKYSVNLNIEDGSVVYLKQLSNSLNSGLSAFEAYFKDFLDNRTLKSEYFKNKKGPWVWALNHLIKATKSFGDHGGVSIGNLEENLYMLASPNTCTIESLSKVVKLYEKVTSMIQHMTEELSTRSKRDVENMNPDTVISGNRTFPLLININHSFSEFVDLKESGQSGYDYFAAPTTNIPGLFTISNENYLSRIRQETSRYFNGQDPQQTDSLGMSSIEYSYLTPAALKLKNKTFRTYIYNSTTNSIANNTELRNFDALINLFNYKKHGKTITETKQTSIEVEQSKVDDCGVENLYAKSLSSFSTHVKNNLSMALSNINVAGSQKYESPCFDSTEKEEADYAKLMMPTATSDRYKSELSSKDIRETHVYEETGDSLNLSSIFAPLFYMNFLNISKEICCFVKALNKGATNNLPNQLKAMSSNGQNLATHTWYDSNGQSSLKKLNNAAFHYLNNKNLMAIEVFTGFERGLINSPSWAGLRKGHVSSAAESGKPMLLCRMRPYINEDLCFAQNELLDLNVFNQCFLLDASQVAAAPGTTTRKAKPVDKITSLDKNDFLKLESNFMRTNLKFGQVVGQITKNKKTRRRRRGRQTTQTGGITAPTMTTTISPGGTSGGGTSGGRY